MSNHLPIFPSGCLAGFVCFSSHLRKANKILSQSGEVGIRSTVCLCWGRVGWLTKPGWWGSNPNTEEAVSQMSHVSSESMCYPPTLQTAKSSQRWPWRKIRIQNTESHSRNMPAPEFPDWQALLHGNTVNRSQMNREMGSFSWAHPKSLQLLPPPASSLNPFSSHLPSIWCQQGLKCLRMDSPTHIFNLYLCCSLKQLALGPGVCKPREWIRRRGSWRTWKQACCDLGWWFQGPEPTCESRTELLSVAWAIVEEKNWLMDLFSLEGQLQYQSASPQGPWLLTRRATVP